jgi:hypothetical protein
MGVSPLMPMISSSPRPPRTAKQSERNREMFFLISGGLLTTFIGVLYAMEKPKIAGSLTMATGLMGTIYGAIRLIDYYDPQIAIEREEAGFED